MGHVGLAAPEPVERKRFRFEVDIPPEPGAGLHGFHDEVTVFVEGDLLDPEGFPEFLATMLCDWYGGHGGTVVPVEDPPAPEPQEGSDGH